MRNRVYLEESARTFVYPREAMVQEVLKMTGLNDRELILHDLVQLQSLLYSDN